VTAWDPPRRFAYRGRPAPDGSLHAFEYRIEGRGGGRALVRLVHSGFLADDWEAEYDALGEGDLMYLHQMARYLEHFPGRAATVIKLFRPNEPARDRAMGIFRRALGLGPSVREGQPVSATLAGLPPIEGVVDFASRGILGVRTGDAFLRFVHTPTGVVFLGHHLYRPDIDPRATTRAWRTWLDTEFTTAAQAATQGEGSAR
jgi:hypothetical protein